MVVVGCGGGSDGAGGGPGSGNQVTITGHDGANADVHSTITGADYFGNNGVQCQHATTTSGLQSALSVNARGSADAPSPELSLDYYGFKLSALERDEAFPSTADADDTFKLSATAYDGTNLFIYAEPDDWAPHLAENPACHTRFTQLTSTEVAGTLSCTNLFDGHRSTVATLTVTFACTFTP